jgi:alcohol dehydrogenase (NADP+)
MVYPDSWKGFQIEDPAKWTDFHLNELTPKPFGDYDVDIKILACGVCASDLHTVSGGWGEQKFPLCVGHGIYFTLFVYYALPLSYIVARNFDLMYVA